jgi:hypothetical protein
VHTTNAVASGPPRRRRRARRLPVAAGVLALLALVAAACVPPPPEPATGPSPNDAPRAAEPAYVGPGPYAAGVTTISLGDRDMEVWYPADPAAASGVAPDEYFVRDFVAGWVDDLLDPSVNPPFVTDGYRDITPAVADGPYPLVLFSHGFAGFRLTTTFLTTHLASWGFVVIAPDYLERGLASVLGDPVPGARSDRVVADEASRPPRPPRPPRAACSMAWSTPPRCSPSATPRAAAPRCASSPVRTCRRSSPWPPASPS